MDSNDDRLYTQTNELSLLDEIWKDAPEADQPSPEEILEWKSDSAQVAQDLEHIVKDLQEDVEAYEENRQKAIAIVAVNEEKVAAEYGLKTFDPFFEKVTHGFYSSLFKSPIPLNPSTKVIEIAPAVILSR